MGVVEAGQAEEQADQEGGGEQLGVLGAALRYHERHGASTAGQSAPSARAAAAHEAAE